MKKQTKIIATISDRKCDHEFIQSLWDAGMDAVRLNTAHQDPETTLQVVEKIRAVSESIGIILDTKGPEVRTVNVDQVLTLKTGDSVALVAQGADHPELPSFSVSYSEFINDIPLGSKILIDDGQICLQVDEKSDFLLCTVTNDGVIENKRSVNVPGVHLKLPSLTEKDKAYLKLATEHNIDFIAHSFVRNREDMEEVMSYLQGSDVKVIAKIENREGVDNITEILDYAYGIMVARGDLGIEIPYEEVPGIQKLLIRHCISRACPVITATQLLHTMIDNPRPTRAEVSDIANAIYDGTDAIMLSGETAYGKYPVESVKTMATIASRVEKSTPRMSDLPVFSMKNKLRNFLAKSAVQATVELPAQAMVIDTETGHSARIVAAYRGSVPAYAKSPSISVIRQLSISYGIYAEYMATPGTTDELVARSLESLIEQKKIDNDDLIVILAGTPHHSQGSNFIEINTARLCLSGRRKEK